YIYYAQYRNKYYTSRSIMRAAIDIGSNSIRLALSDGTGRSTITKLADGLEATGKLSPAGVIATIAALREYSDACRAAGCDEITVFATEAVRRANDGAEFCSAVKAQAHLDVIILSPDQEARLALAGVTKPDGAITVCDLGGGSLEVICSADGKTPSYIKSLPLGVVVMKNKFNGDYRRAIDELPALLREYGDVPNYPVVIAGGSACTIAAGILDLKVYDKTKVSALFTAKQLDDIMPILLSPKLALFRPVCQKRADTLPYGAIVIQALLNYLGATEFFVSDASNLEAVLNGALDVM
ncbi:MAG: hypothetical protein K2L54_04635, partial [Clostridiales bacterium]|nr:hypothetical protein [Clostridiales bacterium]